VAQPGRLTHLAKQSRVFHTMCRHAGFWLGGAGRRELTRASGARGGGHGERLSGLCGLCCVFSLSVSLLFLFPLFAALLNCPYPDSSVSASFFPFSSASRWGEGQPRGAFVAGCSQTITIVFSVCHWLSVGITHTTVYSYHLLSPQFFFLVDNA